MIEEKFWKKVNKKESCWEWTGGLTKDGYGRKIINGKRIGVHRISWKIKNKTEIPEGMVIMHKCDNPKCVNPDHLQLGTQRDNCIDKVKKGRVNFAKGSRHGRSKITEIEVEQIKKMICDKKSTQFEIAKIFKVSQVLISRIKHGKNWNHL